MATKPKPAAKVKAPLAEEDKDTETFTSTKRESGFMFKNSEFAEGRGNKLIRIGVYIELNRGVEFKPKEFCRNFKGHGWQPGELDAKELIEVLNEKADDRARPEIIRYEDRPRPMAQILLEGELTDSRAKLAEMEQLFEAAAQKDPELLELRKKVMAEA